MAAEAFDAVRLGKVRSERVEAATGFRGGPRTRIGELADRLIVEHPDWTYRRITEEVNTQWPFPRGRQ